MIKRFLFCCIFTGSLALAAGPAIYRNPLIYAATLRYHDGNFHIITIDVNGGGNFCVTAKNPDELVQTKQVAFLGRRLEEMKCSAEIRFEFAPTCENEDVDLAEFRAVGYHHEVFLSQRKGGNVIVLPKSVGDMVLEAVVAPVSGRNFRLKVNATTDHYTFSYSEADAGWKQLGTGLPDLIATEVAGVWSGKLLGPYCSGKGGVCSNPGGVAYFEYRNEND